MCPADAFSTFECRRCSLGQFPHDRYIGPSLSAYGEWSFGEIVLLRQVLSSAANLIEVGSNIGAHTVPLARHTNEGRVLAFEPQRICYQLLCANLANNDCANVEAVNAAVGMENGYADVPDPDPGRALNFGGISVTPVASPSLVRGTVRPLIRLDDAVAPDMDIALIKCDAEGMERDVVEGAEALIARNRPFLYLEDDRPEQSEALFKTVQGMDYDIWWHPVPLFRADNLAANPNNIFPGIYSFNLFCAPRERAFSVNGLKRLTAFSEHPRPPKPVS